MYNYYLKLKQKLIDLDNSIEYQVDVDVDVDVGVDIDQEAEKEAEKEADVEELLDELQKFKPNHIKFDDDITITDQEFIDIYTNNKKHTYTIKLFNNYYTSTTETIQFENTCVSPYVYKDIYYKDFINRFILITNNKQVYVISYYEVELLIKNYRNNKHEQSLEFIILQFNNYYKKYDETLFYNTPNAIMELLTSLKGEILYYMVCHGYNIQRLDILYVLLYLKNNPEKIKNLLYYITTFKNNFFSFYNLKLWGINYGNKYPQIDRNDPFFDIDKALRELNNTMSSDYLNNHITKRDDPNKYILLISRNIYKYSYPEKFIKYNIDDKIKLFKEGKLEEFLEIFNITLKKNIDDDTKKIITDKIKHIYKLEKYTAIN